MNKWTLEKAHSEALKYKYKKDFRENSTNAYKWCWRNNYLDVVCSHMKLKYLKLTTKIVTQEALKYKTKQEFKKANNRAYQYALDNKIINDICQHMKIGNRKWTLELVKNEALKYKFKKDFRENSYGAYKWCYKNTCLNIVCSHMIKEYPKPKQSKTILIKKSNSNKKARQKWNVEKVKKEALKYKYKKDFRKNNLDAYTWAHKHNVVNIVCEHMKSGYTDLTEEIVKIEALKYKTKKEFEKGHSRAYFYAHEKNIIDNICSHMESGRGKWNLLSSQNEALRYTTKKDFQDNSKGAYLYAIKQGILNQICSHMVTGYGFWTIPLVQKEALRYESRKDFERNSCGAYCFAYRNGCLDEICSHMLNKAKTDNDVIYIWKAISLGKWNDKNIYKVGKTSARLGEERIYFVANEANIDVDIVIISRVNCKASDLETKVLRLGEKTNLSGFNGASEFRAFSHNELEEAIDMITPYIEKDILENEKKHNKTL